MATAISRPRRIETFEDLRGLRAEGYVRDSTLDQRDGFGPDIQRGNIRRFATSYGLVLGGRWYTEFVSGRTVAKRDQFQQFLQDARLDLFDVLLVDHTSRFGRNQEEAIRFKGEMQRLGKIVVFVSQGIISGRDQDFLNERINETLDEGYSRNLSRYVRAGFAEKAAQGHAIGRAPLGYRTEKASSGRGARLIPDERTMPVLLELLGGYASGEHSFDSLARSLNAKGHRTSYGLPFAESSVNSVLVNRFYEGKIVYHKGQEDEQVIDGAHQVPDEVKRLWLRCQEVRRQKAQPGHASPPSRQHQVYPLTGVLVCDGCGRPFHGKAARQRGKLYPRMMHSWHRCGLSGVSLSAERVQGEFVARVLAPIRLDDGWRDAMLRALATEGPQPDIASEIRRIERAQERLRKQHLWEMMADEEFRRQHEDLERQRRVLVSRQAPVLTPNLDRAAQLLMDLPALWEHPGVTGEQRRDLAREVFEEVRVRAGKLVAIRPQPQYVPLFAYASMRAGVVCGKQPA